VVLQLVRDLDCNCNDRLQCIHTAHLAVHMCIRAAVANSKG
jgi:hypothetical protein